MKVRIRTLFAGALVGVLGLFMFAVPAWAAPSLAALPYGYVGFWEHTYFGGIKSMYYQPTGCVTLPHGAGYVGDKVSSMWNRAASGKVWNRTACDYVAYYLQFNNGNGYETLGQFNDSISSYRKL